MTLKKDGNGPMRTAVKAKRLCAGAGGQALGYELILWWEAICIVV
jgi:hypothetical protein